MSTLPTPALTPLFAGVRFADVLNARTAEALDAVHRLELTAWAAPDDPDALEPDPAAAIIAAHDIPLPTIDWDNPDTNIGTTPAQTIRAVTSWAVIGDARALTWRPRARVITAPRRTLGLEGDRVTIYRDGHDVTPEHIDRDRIIARRYVETHLENLTTDRDGWRDWLAPYIRDAARQRRALLDRAAALS